jgi:hypothetical protein
VASTHRPASAHGCGSRANPPLARSARGLLYACARRDGGGRLANFEPQEDFPMNSIARSGSLVALFVAVSAVAACNGGGEEDVDAATQQLSSDGVEAMTSDEQSTAGMAGAALEGPSAEPVAAADALLAAPPEPAEGSCRSRAKDPNDPATVIITLDNCPMRFGKHFVSGTEIVNFTKGEGVLHADFHSEGLTIDGRPASHTASADITFEGGERHVAWQGAWETTNARGEAVSHTSELSIVVDVVSRCRTRNGSAVTYLADRQIDTTFQDVQVCRDAEGDRGCPSGTVTHANAAKGKTVTVEFDGSDQATVTAPSGATFEKQLVCGG